MTSNPVTVGDPLGDKGVVYIGDGKIVVEFNFVVKSGTATALTTDDKTKIKATLTQAVNYMKDTRRWVKWMVPSVRGARHTRFVPHGNKFVLKHDFSKGFKPITTWAPASDNPATGLSVTFALGTVKFGTKPRAHENILTVFTKLPKAPGGGLANVTKPGTPSDTKFPKNFQMEAGMVIRQMGLVAARDIAHELFHVGGQPDEYNVSTKKAIKVQRYFVSATKTVSMKKDYAQSYSLMVTQGAIIFPRYIQSVLSHWGNIYVFKQYLCPSGSTWVARYAPPLSPKVLPTYPTLAPGKK